MLKYVPARTVYEHAQDNAVNCGRACAQMVISSLTQGPPTGSPPTPADEQLLVPVTQDELRQREWDPIDNVKVPSWKTHPDELLWLLTGAHELKGDQAKWRLAVHNTVQQLFAELTLALKEGMPAILNLYASDHWAVVVGVAVDDVTFDLRYIEVLDPLPQKAGVQHTYIDDCSRLGEGLTFADPVKFDTTQLANLQLEIGATPTPPTLTDYTGKFVVLVHSSWRDSIELKRLTKLFRKRPVPPLPPEPKSSTASAIGVLSIDVLRHQLQAKAEDWGIPRLSDLLASRSEHVVRLVRDVNGLLAPYHLASVFSDDLGYGLVGIFDARDNSPLHFRFTNNRSVAGSLERHQSDELWWTREWLPTLASPYFPFHRQVVDNKLVYRRMFDDFSFERSA